MAKKKLHIGVIRKELLIDFDLKPGTGLADRERAKPVQLVQRHSNDYIEVIKEDGSTAIVHPSRYAGKVEN